MKRIVFQTLERDRHVIVIVIAIVNVQHQNFNPNVVAVV
jgi:hypothetical protein